MTCGDSSPLFSCWRYRALLEVLRRCEYSVVFLLCVSAVLHIGALVECVGAGLACYWGSLYGWHDYVRVVAGT